MFKLKKFGLLGKFGKIEKKNSIILNKVKIYLNHSFTDIRSTNKKYAVTEAYILVLCGDYNK